jgi:hypothetical protein
MIKRRGRSQIRNLTLDHKSLETKGQMRSDWSMLYTIGKIFSRAIRHFPHIFKKNKKWLEKYMSVQSLGRTRIVVFGIQFWESQGKVTFGCSPHKKAYNILYGGEWCLLPKVASRVKLVLKFVFIKFIAPFPFNLHITALFSWLYKLFSFWTFAYEFVLVPSRSSITPSYPWSVAS